MFLKVNPPRFVGELTPKVDSRPESETIIFSVVYCKIIEGRIWVLVHSRVAAASERRGHNCKGFQDFNLQDKSRIWSCLIRAISLDSGYNIGNAQCRRFMVRVSDSGYKLQDSGSRVQGSGFRVKGSGLRAQGEG